MGSAESRDSVSPPPNALENGCSWPGGAMMATASPEMDCWNDSDLQPVVVR